MRAGQARSFLSASCPSGGCFTVLISDAISSKYRSCGVATRKSIHHALLRAFVSHQASSETSCCWNVGLYLISLFSIGNLHQIWPRPLSLSSEVVLPKYRNPFVASCSSVIWTRFRNTTLDYAQQNTAIDFFVSRFICVSLRCLWSAHRALRPLGYMVLIDD